MGAKTLKDINKELLGEVKALEEMLVQACSCVTVVNKSQLDPHTRDWIQERKDQEEKRLETLKASGLFKLTLAEREALGL